MCIRDRDRTLDFSLTNVYVRIQGTSSVNYARKNFRCYFQKTAYEMRESDWSSDVCSSDLFVCKVVSGDVLYVEADGLL